MESVCICTLTPGRTIVTVHYLIVCKWKIHSSLSVEQCMSPDAQYVTILCVVLTPHTLLRGTSTYNPIYHRTMIAYLYLHNF